MKKILVDRGIITFSNSATIEIDVLGFYIYEGYDFAKLQRILDLIETIYILDRLHGTISIDFPLSEFIIIEACMPVEFRPFYLDELLKKIDLDKYRAIVSDQIKRLEETSRVFFLDRMPWTRYDDQMLRRIGFMRRLAIYITPTGDKETEVINEQPSTPRTK